MNRLGIVAAACLAMGFLGGFITAMLVAPPIVHLDARGLDVGMALTLVIVAAFVALVLACSTFSRHVEKWLASFREAKRGFRAAWDAADMAESARLFGDRT
jgi:predicted PurR-regulated permease PerM